MPTVDFTSETYNLKKLKKPASRYIENKAIEITASNIEAFKSD